MMAAPTRITDDEAAYLERVIAQKRTADAVWQHYAGHLAERYAIGPADQITENGEIRRGGGEPSAEG